MPLSHSPKHLAKTSKSSLKEAKPFAQSMLAVVTMLATLNASNFP
jgi:hypothetical protein